MGKQRCGTCRFFEDAGLAGSGWCHHPLRKTTSDLLIMVRRNELACRDEWSHNLWEPGSYGEAVEAPPAAGPAVAPGRPVPPATEQEIAALLKQATPVDDDIVLAEARIVSEARPAWQAPAAPEPAPPEPAPPNRRTYDAKTALKRAREAYRERVRQQATLDGAPVAPLAAVAVVPAGAESRVDAPAAAEAIPAEPEPATAEAAVVEPAATPPEPLFDAAFDLEEPAVAAPRAAEAADAGSAALDADSEDDLDAVAAWDADDAPEDAAGWGPAGFAPVAAGRWEPPAAPIGPITSGRFRAAAESKSAPVAGPVLTPWSAAAADPDIDEWWSSERTDDPTLAWERWDDEAWSEEEFLEPHEAAPAAFREGPGAFAEPEAAEAVEDATAEGSGSAAFEATAWDEEALVAATAIAPEPATAWGSGRAAPTALAPTMPRICRTCRDFRPAEGGERGWCANKWAFTHRRVVGADDAAPCESSIGCWWLPADDLCLSDADISTHGQPTPFLDRWLPHWRDADVKRRRS